jgi:serine protease Do
VTGGGTNSIAVAKKNEGSRERVLAAFGLLLALALSFALVSPALAKSTPRSFADIAEVLSPAVVNISTEQAIEIDTPPTFDIPEGNPFADRFKDFLEAPRNQPAPRRSATQGSGFVVDPSGIVVTNNHVIEGADTITVKFSDGRSLVAEVIGRDPKTDIAVLKVVPKEPLSFVEFGASDAVRVGDWAIAIGNPFGLGGTVTAGIISARDRETNRSGPYADYIQTDASINQGNSGGPLFDLNGRVIGVNTAIYSPTGGSVGIGFAIPSNVVKKIVAELNEKGEISRGWLGVRVQDVTEDIASSLTLASDKGALVASVMEDSPAERSDLRVGDIILTFDGKPIDRMRDLPRVVGETEVGKKVKVSVFRDGKEQMIKVKVEKLDDEPVLIAEAAPEPEAELSRTAFGLSLMQLSDALRAKYNIDEEVQGVLVVDVANDSPALGHVRPGDVIVEVAQQEVKSPDSAVNRFESSEKSRKGKPILLLLSRQGAMTFVTVQGEG